MAGIYIHIPFCRSRCIYCGFYSTTSLELRQRYVDALCREMEIRRQRSEVRGENIETIYLGGGTPSQLTFDQLRQLFIYINKVYPLPSKPGGAENRPEITIEVNPDDVTVEFAAVLQQLPVNRVSMGIQTFDDQRLRFLRRRHTARQAIEAVSILRAAGIRNISIDLMYGFPGETLADWEADIDAALALNVEHLSAYCLMIEEGTPLYRMLKQHTGDEETERQMYEVLIDRLTTADYEHYEISNFARITPPTGGAGGGHSPFRSRHNSSYWNGTPYIGLGAAAHSYDIRSRSWNVADIRQYIEGMERCERIFEEELLDDDTRYNDIVTVALRTREGIDLNALSEKYRNYCIKNARRYLDDGLLELTTPLSPVTSHLRLTRRGLFVSDMVMSNLMMV